MKDLEVYSPILLYADKHVTHMQPGCRGGGLLSHGQGLAGPFYFICFK